MALQHFKIGDAVTIRSEEDNLYVIVGVNGYKKFQDDKFVDTYDYELILVLPVKKGVKMKLEEEGDLILYAKYKTKLWTTMVTFAQKDRQKNGMFGQPEFVKMVEDSLLGDMGLKKIDIPRIAMKNQDAVINYETLETVDECLDCMNDLKMLEKILKDKEFGKIRKKVVKRLKELLK